MIEGGNTEKLPRLNIGQGSFFFAISEGNGNIRGENFWNVLKNKQESSGETGLYQ